MTKFLDYAKAKYKKDSVSPDNLEKKKIIKSRHELEVGGIDGISSFENM